MISLLLVAGCGFKPRGSGYETLAGQQVVLQSMNNYGPLERSIREQFSTFSIHTDTLHELGDNNGIQIKTVKLSKNTVSVDATGRPAEYETIINVEVIFHLKNNQQHRQKFSVRRDYRYDKNNTLAHDRELEILISEMNDDLAHRIVVTFLGQLVALDEGT